MIFGFFSSRPRITEREFRRLMSNFSRFERERLEMIFLGDMHERDNQDQGIDKDEFKARIEWMRDNMRTHDLSEDTIDELVEKSKRFLR